MYRIYFNLHKHRRVFSVQTKIKRNNRTNWKVIDYQPCLLLYNVRPIIQPGGQSRIRREHKKYVHAFLECSHYETVLTPVVCLNKITYNPYTHDHFEMNGQRFESAAVVAAITVNKQPLVYVVQHI